MCITKIIISKGTRISSLFDIGFFLAFKNDTLYQNAVWNVGLHVNKALTA